MSRKMTKYTTEFKTKIVLEVIKGEKTLNEIASKYNIIPKNIMNWKKIFMDNAENYTKVEYIYNLLSIFLVYIEDSKKICYNNIRG